MKKEFMVLPRKHYEIQSVQIGVEKSNVIWMNARPGGSRSGICLSSEEAIELAKALYKAAYEAGYTK